jgi:hypothetical protein
VRLGALRAYRAQTDAFVAVARFLPKLDPREPSLFAGARASGGRPIGTPDVSLPMDAVRAEAESAGPPLRAPGCGSGSHVSSFASILGQSYGSPGSSAFRGERDRQAVHPWRDFRARVAAASPESYREVLGLEVGWISGGL